MENKPLLIDVLPSLANDIKVFFINKSRPELAEQVNNLRIKEICECGEPDCGSFYLTQYKESEIDFEGFDFEGIGSIEISEEKIGLIEIFPSNFGFEVRSKLMKYL